MPRSSLGELPIDTLRIILDLLDLPTKALLACCSKGFHNAIGTSVFKEVQQDETSARKCFSLLEKDLPTDQFFCPTCVKLHSASIRKRLKTQGLCVKRDRDSKVHRYYGRDFHFCQARYAMRLHHRQDPRASLYLKGLQNVTSTESRSIPGDFWDREVRIVTTDPTYPPQMFLRIRHWALFSENEYKPNGADKLLQYRLTQVQLCHHQRNIDVGRATSDLTGLELAFLKLGHQTKPKSMQQDTVIKPVHVWSSDLYRCQVCAVDHRIDLVYLPTIPAQFLSQFSSQYRSFWGSIPDWAVVSTKWMCLGTLDTQDGAWLRHTSGERECHDSSYVKAQMSCGAFCGFEMDDTITGSDGQLRLKPSWTETLEHQVIAPFVKAPRQMPSSGLDSK